MKKLKVFTVALAVGLVLTTTSYAQGVSNSLNLGSNNLVMSNGFDVSSMVTFAQSAGLVQSRVVSTPDGDIAIFPISNDQVIIGRTFACNSNGCPAFHFVSAFNTGGLNPNQLNFADFNNVRPHGNAAYIREEDVFIIQRLITSFDGLPRGSLEGEFGLFVGYSGAFRQWLTQQSQLIAVVDESQAKEENKIDNNISLNGGNVGEADVVQMLRSLQEAGVPKEEIIYTD